MTRNTLYFGDNLEILREHLTDETVDLVYLDPPFNSQQSYNVLFSSPKGQRSEAQITAFEDTWHWGEQAEREFNEIVHSRHTDVAEVIAAFRRVLNENDMMAYLTMMANRLLELHRVLKPTGSLYLHCDPTASHYLKVVLDATFGPTSFRNEIIWKRTSAHSSAQRYGPVHDVLLFYSKTAVHTWNPSYQKYDDDYVSQRFRNADADGRRWKDADITGAGTRNGVTGLAWRGIDVTAKGRHWMYPPDELDRLDAAGKIYWTARGNSPRLKQYFDELQGITAQDVWFDISPVNSQADERLGYPTQKPVALLERIIKASSNPGDVVLDPFCGCGTAVHAAHKSGRRWIGIDITHVAIRLIEKRLRDAFPDIVFETEGTPKDLEGARDLSERDKYQFQWWACSLVDAQPYKGKRKGADQGIDGLIYFDDVVDGKTITQKIIVSVKGGENRDVKMIRELDSVVTQNNAVMGFFVTLAEPTEPMRKTATKAGFYTAGNGVAYPRLQILTIEGLMSGSQRPKYMDYKRGERTFKKAKTDQLDAGQLDLL